MNSISSVASAVEEIKNNKQQYICVFDQEYKLIDCCAHYAAMIGLDDTELLGKSLAEIYSGESIEREAQFHKVLATGIPISTIFQLTLKSNEVIELEEQISKLSNGLVVIGKDITKSNKDRKKEEQEYQLSLIAKHSSQYFLLVDLEGTILFIDKTYRGLKIEDVIGSNIHSYNDEETELKIRKSMAKVVITKEPETYEAYADVGEENRMIFEGTIFPIIEDNGAIVKLAITTNGITERKKIEEELKAINRQYLALLQQTNSIAYTQNKELKYTNILNPSGILSENSALGKTDRDLITPFNEEAKIIEAVKLEVLQTGKTIRKDIKLNIFNEIFYFDVLVQPLFNDIKEIIGISCTSINITERINRKEALIESERKLNEAEEIAQLGYYDLDITSRNIDWSEETYRMIGVTPEEYQPNLDSYLDFFHPADKTIVTDALEKIIETGEDLEVTYRLLKENKEIQYIRNIAKARFNKDGEINNVYGTVQDVTQQIGLELELKQQKSFIQKIVDSSPSLIFILDIEKRENVFLNNASERLLGYSKEEVRSNHNLFLNQLSNLSLNSIKNNNLSKESTTFLSFIHPAERQLFVEFVRMFVEDKSDHIFDLNFRHQHKNGNWLWLHHRIVAFDRDEKGRVTQLLGIVSDISSLKEAEKKSKLAMIEGQEKERRRMAKDLHDAINPLLSAAKLNVESLQYQTKADNEQHTNIANIVTLLGQSMDAIKDISFNLMPSILKDFGLVFTLKDYCNKITEGGVINVSLDLHGIEQRLDNIKEVMLFRMAQELINNVIKHANATQIEIQLIAHQKPLF